jgi:putative transposase
MRWVAQRLIARPRSPRSRHSSKVLGPQAFDVGCGVASGAGPDHSLLCIPPEVRKIIYTTNAIEGVNAWLLKIIKTRGHFPSDVAANKLIWLALRNITPTWGHTANDGRAATDQFAILYADRFTRARRFVI